MATTSSIIKVDTQLLIGTADKFDAEGKQVGNITSQMMDLVMGLSAQWEGDASRMYIEHFKALEDDITRLLAKINEYVEDIHSIANVYNTYETKSTEEAQSLAQDIIS